MKVMGLANSSQYDGDRQYICVINHTELSQYMGMYYSEKKLELLKVGEELDLSRAYHFAQRIESAVSKVQDLVKNSQDVINTIMQGMNLLAIQQACEEQRRQAESPVSPGERP